MTNMNDIAKLARVSLDTASAPVRLFTEILWRLMGFLGKPFPEAMKGSETGLRRFPSRTRWAAGC